MLIQQGTKLTAVIYSNHLRYFVNALSPYRRYYISNAVVTKIDAKYQISSYPYSWTLNNRTLIEEFVEPAPVPLPCEFNFANFHDLYKYADTDNLQDIRAVVLRCFESKEQGSEITTRRDVVIVNEEKKLMLLTLWNEFDCNEGHTLATIIDSAPMIFALRVKVTTFNGLSLTTRVASGLMINPPVTERLQMREWYNNNKQELEQLVEKEAYKNRSLLLPYPKDEDIIPVTIAIASIKNLKTAWIRGKISLVKEDRSLWYPACANCHKPVEADLTWIVTCPSCKVDSEVYPICHLPIVIDDETDTIRTNMCSPDAEIFIPFDSAQLKDA